MVMAALHIAVPGPRILALPWNLPGIGLVMLGIGLHTAAFRLFKNRGTTLATLDVPRAPVTEGPFRISRNPMYLAGVLILTGWALVMGSSTPFIAPFVFATWSFRWYIVPEEQLLAEEFGEVYGQYRDRVRRWF